MRKNRHPLPQLNILALAGLLIVTLQTSPLWAQLSSPETKNRWVLSYGLVGLLIGLSLFSVCRGAARYKK